MNIVMYTTYFLITFTLFGTLLYIETFCSEFAEIINESKKFTFTMTRKVALKSFYRYLNYFNNVKENKVFLTLSVLIFITFGIGGFFTEANFILSKINQIWILIFFTLFIIIALHKNLNKTNILLLAIILTSIVINNGNMDIDLIVANQIEINSHGLPKIGIVGMPGTFILLIYIIINNRSMGSFESNVRSMILIAFGVTVFLGRDELLQFSKEYIINVHIISLFKIMFFTVKYLILSLLINLILVYSKKKIVNQSVNHFNLTISLLLAIDFAIRFI